MGSSAKSVPAHGCSGHRMDRHTNIDITIKEREKSLEVNSTPIAVKPAKVVYSTNFSIKPLIKFFNKTLKKGSMGSKLDVRSETNSTNNKDSMCNQPSIDDVFKDTSDQSDCISDTSSTCSDSVDMSFGDISFSSITDCDIFDEDIKELELAEGNLSKHTRAPTVVIEEEFGDDLEEADTKLSQMEVPNEFKNSQPKTITDEFNNLETKETIMEMNSKTMQIEKENVSESNQQLVNISIEPSADEESNTQPVSVKNIITTTITMMMR